MDKQVSQQDLPQQVAHLSFSNAKITAKRWGLTWMGIFAAWSLLGYLGRIDEIGRSIPVSYAIVDYFGGVLMHLGIASGVGFVVGLFRHDIEKISLDIMDSNKVMANLYVLQHGSYEAAKSRASFDKVEKELLEFATDSIKKIDPLGEIPLGFTHNFVATYPDVVVWMNNLSDERHDKLLGNIDEKDALDEDNKIKPKYLRLIIDAYKEETGANLECLSKDV